MAAKVLQSGRSPTQQLLLRAIGRRVPQDGVAVGRLMHTGRLQNHMLSVGTGRAKMPLKTPERFSSKRFLHHDRWAGRLPMDHPCMAMAAACTIGSVTAALYTIPTIVRGIKSLTRPYPPGWERGSSR